MAKPTKLVVHKGKDGLYYADFVDKQGKVWGRAESVSRTEAVQLARKQMPARGVIRKMTGWTVHHPVKSALIAGAYITIFRPLIRLLYYGTQAGIFMSKYFPSIHKTIQFAIGGYGR